MSRLWENSTLFPASRDAAGDSSGNTPLTAWSPARLSAEAREEFPHSESPRGVVEPEPHSWMLKMGAGEPQHLRDSTAKETERRGQAERRQACEGFSEPSP